MSRPDPIDIEGDQDKDNHRELVVTYNSSDIMIGQAGEPLSESSALLDASADFVGTQNGQDSVNKRPLNTFRINSLTQVGGVNSIENFARSWTRAATFIEVTPQETSFILEDKSDSRVNDKSCWDQDDTESGGLPESSTLWTNTNLGILENNNQNRSLLSENQTTSGLIKASKFESLWLRDDSGGVSSSFRGSISAATAQQPNSPFGSYGTSYEALQSEPRASTMRNAVRIWKQQQFNSNQESITGEQNERAPVLLKEVDQDGRKVLMVAGQSTLPQTIFNSTNVLVGIGILSLPLGFKYAGWIPGMIILSSAALVTSFTAQLLAKCMDLDASLITFADVAFLSFGETARTLISLLFTTELVAANVGSIVLFADTLDALVPTIGVLGWKIFCGFLLIPLNFLPLRLLSFTSVIGIFACLCIVSIIIMDGFIKPNTPGSLLEPAKTYLFPENWLTLPLSIGLLMSPWGGHSVFPNIYRDMRHPRKYTRAVTITFTFTYFLDLCVAISGILMFGDKVTNEISANILNTPGYPRFLSIFLSTTIAVIPITKIPLNSSPLLSTAENLAGLNLNSKSGTDLPLRKSTSTRKFLKAFLRVAAIIIFVIISILFPSFDNIMAFMGSALCITISVILPPLFYLKLFANEIPLRTKYSYYLLIILSTCIAFIGTFASFSPKSSFAD